MATRRPATKRKAAPKRAAKTPAKRGRPSDYRPELCGIVGKLALLGLTDEEMAECIGKPITTFNRWKAEHEEFRESLKQAKKPADAEVAASLFQRAKGYQWDEEQAIKLKEITYGENGKKSSEVERVQIVTVRRVVPPDTMACMYWLNNRDRDRWRHKVDHEHGGKGGGPIILYRDDEGL